MTRTKSSFQGLSQIKNFAEGVLRDDILGDWNLAKNLGEFVIRLGPEDILGHALVARACRYVGDRTRALEEIERCPAIFS